MPTITADMPRSLQKALDEETERTSVPADTT
jgi:hypothetical protein